MLIYDRLRYNRLCFTSVRYVQ